MRYPALLMMAADHDDRVDPLHARKFVAAVQNAPGNRAPALLRIEANAGHGGADQVAKAIEPARTCYAFLFHDPWMCKGSSRWRRRRRAADRPGGHPAAARVFP